MIYSTFNWDTGLYEYYTGEGEGLGVRPKPRSVMNDNNNSRGHSLETVLPIVPRGARRVGQGHHPRGRLAIHGSSTFAGFDGSGNPLETHPWLTLGLWVGGFLVSVKVCYWLSGKLAEKV